MAKLAKKSKAQKAFEKEKARVSQILLDRGEEIPAREVFDEAWLREWNDNEALEARKPEVLRTLLDNGETPPVGGITNEWLRTRQAAEEAEAQRVKAEAQRVKEEARRAATIAAAEDAEAKAEFNRVAKEQAEYHMWHGTSAHSEDDPNAGSSSVGDDDDRGGSLMGDVSYLSDDDEEFLEALFMMADGEPTQDLELEPERKEVLEEIEPPQKKQKTEGKQSSVEKPASKPATVIQAKIMGWCKRGNARKALAQDREAKLLEKSEDAIFEERGIDLQDEDQNLNEQEKKATVDKLPPRFMMSSDPRLGKPAAHSSANVDEEERLKHFDETARKIIRFLKSTAENYWELPKDTKRVTWQPMVKGMMTLLRRASEDYLLECLLSGIDDSVRSTLGKSDFTIEDLVSLPGGSVEQNIEKGIYLDVLHLLHGAAQIRQLYVGAAAGKFGLAQRWYGYLTRQVGRESGKHSKELMKSGSTVCLRALARYGHTPLPWLVCFAETFFMLYLGTIEDPGYRHEPGHRAESFLNDVLYENVKECRLSAGLTSRIAVGLNSTWSLSQGYSWAAYASSGCEVCKRPVVSKKDPKWEPNAFVSCNAERPGEDVVCVNCLAYRKKFGFDRTEAKEARLAFRKTVPVPKVCQAPKCSRQLMSFHEQEEFFEVFKKTHADERMPLASPVTGKWIPRIFQHDKVHYGKHFWVCGDCQARKMGYYLQLSGNRVNYGYSEHKRRQALSQPESHSSA